MAHFTYEEFKTEVMNNIMDHLTDDYQEFSMRIVPVKKAGEEYDGLMIEPEEKNGIAIPALDLTSAYNRYKNGTSFDEILNNLADIRMNAKIPDFDIKNIFNFEIVKDRIYPKLLNKDSCSDYIVDKPHIDVADLTIVYSIRINEDGTQSVAITDQLLEAMKVSFDDIREAAEANLTHEEHVFVNLEEAIFLITDRVKTEPIEDIDLEKYVAPFFILTSKHKMFGASMVMNSSIMDRIVKKFGKIFILPSSIHEVMICPQSAAKASDLAKTVRDVNSHEVRPEDQLSDNIYEYDIDSHSISIVS